MLYWNSSSKSRALATITQKHVMKALKLKSRGAKGKRPGDRGAMVLRFTNAPCIITEPFFIDNNSDLKTALEKQEALAAAYAAAIDEYATSMTTSKPTKTAVKVVRDSISSSQELSFHYENLTKKAFFKQNEALLISLIASINSRLESNYGSNYNQLTKTDVWVILNSEMAMKGRHVNPFARHSLGEKGLLPLPGNLKFWNGSKEDLRSPLQTSRHSRG